MNNWINTNDSLPELFNVVGIKVSTYVLVYSDGYLPFCIACLWVIDNKSSWTTYEGRQISKPTHWKYLISPHEAS